MTGSSRRRSRTGIRTGGRRTCASRWRSWTVASAGGSAGDGRRLVLVGSTASGKSRVALGLAERLGGEIVGADSRQIYRGLEVGTGAPSRDARACIPHHLIAFLDPSETYSAGHYGRDARAAVAAIEARGRAAVVAGGSGLYVRALLQGLFEGPPSRPEIRRRLQDCLEREGLAALRAQLARVDPDALVTILPGDAVRVIRALEVYESTGTPISALRKERAPAPMAARVFGLRWPRALLAERIRVRLEAQLRSGFLDEARRLVTAGLPGAAPGPRTLGYRELLAHFRGEVSLDEAARLIALRTRQLAKRQETWFRKAAGVEWLDVRSEGDLDRVTDGIASRLETPHRGGSNSHLDRGPSGA